MPINRDGLFTLPYESSILLWKGEDPGNYWAVAECNDMAQFDDELESLMDMITVTDIVVVTAIDNQITARTVRYNGEDVSEENDFEDEDEENELNGSHFLNT